MSAFRYGELFAGAGGLSLGLERAGMSCAFHAELADFPRRVLSHRWPSVPLYGDVTTLDGRALVASHGAIDLLAGGSPCQDMSVAGKRAGLQGERSGLFFEQIRLWEETAATYLLWENVTGALSSNAGADFAAVLSAIVGAAVHVPSDGWRGAGVVSGATGVAAWRLLDAQWFGVPQRRLRVFVLGARAGGVDPAEVLLEPEGVRRHPPTRGEAGEGTPVRADDRATGTLTSNGDAHSGFRDTDGLVVSFDWQKGNDVSNVRPSTMNVSEEQAGTLAASRVPAVCSFGWQNSQSQGDDVSHGSVAPMRTGTTPAVLAYDTTQVTSKANGSNPRAGDPCHPLAAGAHAPLLVPDVANTLCASGTKGWDSDPSTNTFVVANAVCAREAKGWDPANAVGNGTVSHGIPRRLMPIECERLMGWPDGHTDVPDEKGKPASDAARYKACGNGVVSNVAQWIGERLVALHASLTQPGAA